MRRTAAPPDLQRLPVDLRPEGCDIIIGDALAVLGGMEGGRFRCCVTSPPYWGLRDYGIAGQIGAEARLDDYLLSLA